VPRIRAHVVLALTLGAALLAPARAGAQARCRNISVSGVAFGLYDPVGANATVHLDAAGTISYDCIAGARPVIISLSRGGSGSYAPRAMRSGASTLAYNLYQDAARTVVWGDGTGGSSSVTGPQGANRTLSIYGRVFAGQSPAVGAYSDAIVVTFDF